MINNTIPVPARRLCAESWAAVRGALS